MALEQDDAVRREARVERFGGLSQGSGRSARGPEAIGPRNRQVWGERLRPDGLAIGHDTGFEVRGELREVVGAVLDPEPERARASWIRKRSGTRDRHAGWWRRPAERVQHPGQPWDPVDGRLAH